MLGWLRRDGGSDVTVLIDTLKLSRKLEDGGLPREQAESVAEALGDSLTGADLATKADLSSALALAEQRIVNKIGGYLIAAVTATVALLGALGAALRFLFPIH